jgi:transmembrane sensor
LMGGLALAVGGGSSFAYVAAAQANVYQTDVGEQRHISLKDGTSVFMDTDTKLVVNFDAQHRKVQLRYGRANFRVAPDAKRSFAVEAAKQVVTGSRSTFDVHLEENRVSVLLIQGQAIVTNDQGASDRGAGASQVLSGGERLVFTPDKSPKLDKPDLLPLLAWHTGQAIFEDCPLTKVVREMNRYSTIKLELADTRIEKMKLSGVYRVGDSANFARSLARLLPVELHMEDDRIELVGDDARILQG